jgi:HlyD family secretion protein
MPRRFSGPALTSRTTLALLICGPLLLAACQRPATTATATTASGTAQTIPASSTPAANNLDAAPSKTTTLQVQVVPASAGSLTVSRSASGTVKASRDSNVASQASGAVARVLLQVGDRVSAGQAIVALDDSALLESVQAAQLQLQNAQINLTQAERNTGQNGTQLRASLSSAQASLAKARQTETANRDLYALGGISRSDLISSQAALAQAESDYAQASNSLNQNGQGGSVSLPLLRNQVQQAQASLTQAQTSLARATVRAPFAGVIADLPVSAGEFVQTGATAFRLVDTSALSVDFKVAPEDAAGLPTGTPVNISTGDQKLTGKVKEGDRVAGTDRLVPISVRLDAPPAGNLPVGGAVQVRYRVNLGGSSGLQVPVSAIQQNGGSNVVFTEVGGVARQTDVGILAESGERAVVSGLNSGDRVISPIPPSLADGSLVQVARKAAP